MGLIICIGFLWASFAVVSSRWWSRLAEQVLSAGQTGAGHAGLGPGHRYRKTARCRLSISAKPNSSAAFPGSTRSCLRSEFRRAVNVCSIRPT